jgi:hypothetical protein
MKMGLLLTVYQASMGPRTVRKPRFRWFDAPTLYDNPGLQSPPDEPEILVPTRRPGGGIHFVALKR